MANMRQLKIEPSTTNHQELRRYLADVSKHPLINQDEEVRLARLIKEGDRTALDKLVRANLRFVISIAKRYKNFGLPLPDLINEGNIGLIKAAERFDETRGFKFVSYAVNWVRQQILLALAERARTVRLPQNQTSRQRRIDKVLARLEQEYERYPAPEEVAEALDLPIHKVKETMRVSKHGVCLDEPLADTEGAGTLLDVLADKGAPNTDIVPMFESLRADIERSLQTLDDQEAIVLRLFFGLGGEDPHTLVQIAFRLKMTGSRAGQIKGKALSRLRTVGYKKLLKRHLG